MQQGLDYAETLKIPFVFSSNGDGFVFHDRTGASAEKETTIDLDAFPSPGDLWARYRAWKGLTPEAEAVVLQNYFDDGGGKAPRYYQVNAINAAIEAIAKGGDRILLVMATGTGKTYTAFQIIWRLWKAGRKKRILFLADRNVLVDQTMVNDFRPFGAAMAKLSTKAKTIERADGSSGELTSAIDGRRRIDTAYEIYLGLYQAITGPEERQKIFREFSPGFFDLIVIDECHRGSAAEDSAWREILEYFSSATQIGLTATPKETRYVSNIDYFGPPVYTYSLKQGIRDGFLAPYKVVKVHIDRDVEGYRPEKGQLDGAGNAIEDRIYNTRDFDRVLVLDERTKLVARKVTAFLKESGNRFQKAIVFCVDQEHAGRMRQALINENADLMGRNHRYVMRITGNDPARTGGARQLHRPGIGVPGAGHHVAAAVDRRRCADLPAHRARPRGRLDDRVQADRRARDPGARGHQQALFHVDRLSGCDQPFRRSGFRRRARADLRARRGRSHDPATDDDMVRYPRKSMATTERFSTTGPTPTGRPREAARSRSMWTASPRPSSPNGWNTWTRTASSSPSPCATSRRGHCGSASPASNDFLKRWNAAERKQAILDELDAGGLPLEQVAAELNRDLDPFDLICHVAFDAKPLTRRERADNVRKRNVFARYGDQARAVLDALLAKYADEGVLNLDDATVLRIPPFTELGTPVQLIKAFGGKDAFVTAVHELQSALYREVA